MGATAAVGLGVFQATTQVMGGLQAQKEAGWNAQAAQQEASYNAGIYRQQAGMVEQQRQLKMQQDARKISFTEGKITQMTAAKGLKMSGSPVAVLNDTMTQMEMDKAISSYNYRMESHFLETKARGEEMRGRTIANAYMRKGRQSMIGGMIGGLTTLAGTAMYGYQRFGSSPASSMGGTSSGNYYKPLSYSGTRSFQTSSGAIYGGSV